MLNLTEYHSKFPGSVRWKLTPQGLLVENRGLFAVPADIQIRANKYLKLYASLFSSVSRQLQVPLELLAACALTEGAPVNPESSIRKEPGYISDEQTPNRISAGFCQLLISTARSVMHSPAIDRAWLLDPTNSLVACASYMLQQKPLTGFIRSTPLAPTMPAGCTSIPIPAIGGLTRGSHDGYAERSTRALND